jgi:cytochrome c553
VSVTTQVTKSADTTQESLTTQVSVTTQVTEKADTKQLSLTLQVSATTQVTKDVDTTQVSLTSCGQCHHAGAHPVSFIIRKNHSSSLQFSPDTDKG